MATSQIAIRKDILRDFCVRNHITKLSLFGSVLTPQFSAHSDVDMLVEFDAQYTPSYFELIAMEMELSEVVGRKVDLRTPAELSRYFRDEVVATALPQYEGS